MELILTKAPNGSLMPVDQHSIDELAKLKIGQGVRVQLTRMRNYAFHRKFFALLNIAFDAWEPTAKEYKGQPVAKNFERFREDVTILAGYYTSSVNLRGDVRLSAKSISFSSMDQGEFEKLYSAVIDVVLQRILANYTRDDLDNVVEQVLRFS